MALAPVPTTATRLPSSSTPGSHLAECSTGPSKASSPSISGYLGSLSGPVPRISTSQVMGPAEVCTAQCLAASSQEASSMVTPKRIRGNTLKRSAVARRYAWISGCGEYSSLQFGLGANENEYSGEGTSQRHPG